MRLALLARLTTGLVVSSFVVFGCAAIAGLDDESGTSSSGQSSGSSGTSATEGGADDIAISPTTVDVAGPCGAVAKQTLSISNNAKNDASYKLSAVDDKMFAFGANAKGIIPPSTTIKIDITATPNVAQKLAAELLLDINGIVRKVPATVGGEGPTFELSKPIVDFGEVRYQNGSEVVPVTIKNSGNKPLDLRGMTASGQASDFRLTPTTAAVEPNGTATINASLAAGAVTPTTTSAKYAPTFGTPVCGVAPTLELRGSRVSTEVTVGSVDFEDQSCNTNPGDRNAIVSNYSINAVQITPSLPAGTPFSIVSPTGMTALAGSDNGGVTPKTMAVKLHFTPGTVPGDKATTLTVNVASQAARTAPVKGRTVGLVLNITPNAFTFTSDGTTEATKAFNINVSGNLIVLFPNYSTPADNGGFSVSGSSPISPLGGGTATVKFKAGAVAPSNGKLVVGPASGVCSQTTVNLTGNKQ